ncbi:hypothetical protein Q5692_36810 [Microcoleus sp. C2C3]|uniref:hypothetical protein n=1 Tax=Microcoleus sp. D2B6 TaxID=3055331 RepID=UPI002FD1AFEF
MSGRRKKEEERRKKEEERRKKTYTACFLVGLKHFPAPLKAETPSREWKEIDNLKMSETLCITRFMFFEFKVFLYLRLNPKWFQFLSKSC